MLRKLLLAVVIDKGIIMGKRTGKFSISRIFKKDSRKFSAPDVISIEAPSAKSKTGKKATFTSGSTIGELSYSDTTKRLYVWNGSDWQFVSSGRQDALTSTIATSSGDAASITLTTSAGTITMTAVNQIYATVDQSIFYSYYMYDTDNNYYSPQRGSLPNQIASITGYESSGVFTITPNSPHDNKVFTFVAVASDGRSQATHNVSLSIS